MESESHTQTGQAQSEDSTALPPTVGWAQRLEVSDELKRLAKTFGAAASRSKPSNTYSSHHENYRKNREKILEKRRARYWADPTAYIRAQEAYRRRYPNRRRAAEWKKLFGVTAEEVILQLDKQGGGCAICGVVGPFGTRRDHLVVDHDHATMKFRGVLCTGCNAGLGQFRDDILRLEKAISYLRRNANAETVS